MLSVLEDGPRFSNLELFCKIKFNFEMYSLFIHNNNPRSIARFSDMDIFIAS